MMQKKMVAIISKLPRNRNRAEIRDVLPWLRKKSDLLSGCKDDILEDVVRNCDYRRAVRDDVVVIQGEIGDCFYIMLSGKTSVYIDTNKSDDDGESANQKQGHGGPDSFGTNSETVVDPEEDTIDFEENVIKKKKSLDRSIYGRFIIHFEDGKSFGEIALISEDSERNATVIADEDTDMLVIHRDLFNRSVKTQQEKEYQERKDFITGCRLFSDWSVKFKHLLEMSIRKESYPFGTPIMKQGDPVDGLFFIISGQAKMTTEPSKHHQQYPKLTTKVSMMEQEFGRHIKENTKKAGEATLTQNQIHVRRKEGYAAAEKRFMSKSVDLCCVEGKEILGDMEVVMEMKTYACTVTCTADTTVFILDNKTYERLILKKNIQTITNLKHDVMKKVHSRLATHKGATVHLLKYVHEKLVEELKPKRKVIAPKTPIDEHNKQAMLAQMIKLYLKDKTPMIDPILPDAFHARLMSEKRNRLIAKRDKKKEEQALHLRQKRRRVPRSLKQLQNSAAETELMHPNRMWFDNPKPSKDRHIRPKTALGIETRSSSDHESFIRPETAHAASVFHLTECEPTEDIGQTFTKEKPIMVTHEFNHVFQQIDNLQREKNEARSKVICSVVAKNEIRSETSRSHLGYKADDMYDMHEDDYFDHETSGPNLKHLEERIKLFCDRVSQRRISDPTRVNMMKSYHVKDGDNVPLSGGTVFVNKKPCVFPPKARVASDVHQHVRRFMITRDPNPYLSSTSSMNIRPKSAFASTTARAKSAW